MGQINETIEIGEKVGGTLSSLVPQLFFDLIGRIIPGFLIIASLIVATHPLWRNVSPGYNAILETYNSIWFPAFWMILAAVYVVSIIFYGMWSFMMNVLHRLIRNNPACKNIFFEMAEAIPDFSFRHDYVKLTSPVTGSRITKLKAEIHMSGSLATAFAACFIITLFIPSQSYIQLFFGASSIGCIYSNLYFSKRFYRSVMSYSTLLKFKDKINFLPGYNPHDNKETV